MRDAATAQPAWMATFLDTLRDTGTVLVATRAAGINKSTPYHYRGRNRHFSEAWAAALKAAGPVRTRRAAARPLARGWRKAFLEHLAETSNVQAAAAHADVPVRAIYTLRQKDPRFAAKWRKALFEGYEQLEMEVLACLRGNLPDRKIDIANAVRQLTVHRKTAAEMRSLEDDDGEQAVLASVERLIHRLEATSDESTGTKAGVHEDA